MQFDENRILNFEFVHCDCYLQITVVPNKIETGSSNNLIDRSQLGFPKCYGQFTFCLGISGICLISTFFHNIICTITP